MKKYLSIFFVLLTVLLSGCGSDYSNDNTSAKAIDGVPDEAVYEYLNSMYNPNQRLYKQDPGRNSQPTYKNEINIYQREDTMTDVDNFIVNLKATVSSTICTKDIELQCEYKFRNGIWSPISTNEIINNIEWNYANLMDCWWVGGVGLNYRAFCITDVNSENQTMNIIDSNNREYSANYEVFDDRIEIAIKYDTAKWIICSEGPRFSGYFMIKK